MSPENFDGRRGDREFQTGQDAVPPRGVSAPVPPTGGTIRAACRAKGRASETTPKNKRAVTAMHPKGQRVSPVHRGPRAGDPCPSRKVRPRARRPRSVGAGHVLTGADGFVFKPAKRRKTLRWPRPRELQEHRPEGARQVARSPPPAGSGHGDSRQPPPPPPPVVAEGRRKRRSGRIPVALSAP
jgi:hypothetical protein